ncbi:hypothetical protein MAR_017398, partial [Mya arenaria]
LDWNRRKLLALDETRRYRCELLKTNTTILKSVIESVPCFGEGKYVLYEFKKMFGGEFADIVGNTEFWCGLLKG